MDSDLRKIQKEVEQLKKQKVKKLALATSIQERNQLLSEIKQLDNIGKSPSALKSFGNTFGKGLKIIGNKLWKATVKGSRNLERNSPEFRQMAQNKPTPSQPFSDLAMTYLPSNKNTEMVRLVKKKVKPIKMKRIKGKRGKKNKFKRQRIVVRSGVQSPAVWDLA